VAYWIASAGDARHRMRVATLAMVACALHNFLDVVGAGPTWPIYPLWPFPGPGWSATWSWTIGDWQNIVIFVLLTVGMFAYAKARNRSPIECFGDRADRWFCGIVRGETRDRPSNPRVRWIIWGVLALGVIAVLAPLGFNPFR